MRVTPAALRPWRRSIRARIVIACAVLFLVLGAILIGVAYTQVGRVLVVPSARQGEVIKPGSNSQINATTDASKRRGFLVFTLAGLGVGTLLAGGLGWAVSRRVLRPLTAVTTAAQAASQENLDRRLALAGPPDELKELADTFDAMIARQTPHLPADHQGHHRNPPRTPAAGDTPPEKRDNRQKPLTTRHCG